jgi:hypothetical protein
MCTRTGTSAGRISSTLLAPAPILIPTVSLGRGSLASTLEAMGVRNSDHPCDLPLRPSWLPARDGPIAPSGGPARLSANRMRMKSESDALRSSPGAPHASPQGKATEGRMSSSSGAREVLARLHRGVAKQQVKPLIGVSDLYRFAWTWRDDV